MGLRAIYAIIFTSQILTVQLTCGFSEDTILKIRREIQAIARNIIPERDMEHFRSLQTDVHFINVSVRREASPLQTDQRNPKEEDSTSEARRPSLTPPRGRRAAAGCPQHVGNFGFNSFDLLTFALLAFNGVFNVINNLNNDNNNNNINAGNHVSDTYNEANSNTDSSSVVVVVVPPIGRRRRRGGRGVDGGGSEAAPADRGTLRLLESTIERSFRMFQNISVAADMKDPCEALLEVCSYLQEAEDLHGSGVLSGLASRVQRGELAVDFLQKNECQLPRCPLGAFKKRKSG